MSARPRIAWVLCLALACASGGTQPQTPLLAIRCDLFRPELPPEAWSLPRWSLHDELGLIVEAGLPVPDALLAATRNAARALDLDDEIGTIRPGRVADLLLRRAELDSILGR